MLNVFKKFARQLISPEKTSRAKYETFKNLLHHDRRCHEFLAELEELYYHNKKVDINVISRLFAELSTSVSNMVSCLSQLTPGSYENLSDYYKKFDFYARFALAPPEIHTSPPYILPINGIFPNDLQVGGKGFHLCRLNQHLGLPVPDGFIISTSAYNHVLAENNLHAPIRKKLSLLHINDPALLHKTSEDIVALIMAAALPDNLSRLILSSFHELQNRTQANKVALRSSAVSEDSAISFAGQYNSILQVSEKDLFKAYKEVLASKFSPRALFYRIANGLIDDATPMAVLVLEMIDAVASGVITTQDPARPQDNTMVLHALQGLGEDLMAGKSSPDCLSISRAKGHNLAMQLQEAHPIHLPAEHIPQLMAWAGQIENFQKNPQEIEWCLDKANRLFILQARSLFIQQKEEKKNIKPEKNSHVLLQGGETASRGAACGKIFHARSEDELFSIPQGAILVTGATSPSFASIIEKLAGVVAEQGSAADHFASVAREFGIPVIVRTGKNCRSLPEGKEVTIWADHGSIYEGCSENIVKQSLPDNIPKQASPVRLAFKMVIDFISPLKLINPADPAFLPESCRSFHDIIRFSHEKAVQVMFSQAKQGFLRKGGAKKLHSTVPLNLYVLDAGQGFKIEASAKEELGLEDLQSVPFLSFWTGLTHKGVNWSKHDHFDWKTFDDVSLAGGIASKKDSAFASYAIISRDYLNLNLRFGYHFALLDALSTRTPEENYIMLRFAGGGGAFAGKSHRIHFIASILKRLDFTTEVKGDLLDARFMRYDEKTTANRLDMVGRLLGATKLMDMILTDQAMADRMVEEFFDGRYDFSCKESA